MTNNGTGWELEKRTHFDEITLNYDKIRPEYLSDMFKDVMNHFVSDKRINALEIGAGTGKATKPFLDAGYDVTAVEIGTNMAEFLVKKFKEYNNFKVIVSAFEDAVLEENKYDLIYAASAFHWVKAEIGCPKMFRLLKSGGVVALFRYNTISVDGDELEAQIQSVYNKYYLSYYTSKKRLPNKPKAAFREPSEIFRGYGFEDLGDYGFKDVSLNMYDAEIIYSADDHIALLDTLADHRNLPESNKTALYDGVKEVIIKHGGYYKVDYVFQSYIGCRGDY